MARRQFIRHLVDASGNKLSGVTISVFLAGTSTSAKLSPTSTSTTVNQWQFTTNTTGNFLFWASDTTYAPTQLFKFSYNPGGGTVVEDNIQAVGGSYLPAFAAPEVGKYLKVNSATTLSWGTVASGTFTTNAAIMFAQSF